ncbi:DNA-processing protein DprA [Sulfurospirillum sp. 1612]|uniref:DNA-processing protein DprA n=1 Tax=Sulfurospirillum sp. 1612 TaxID=3094835 RepID=UPI002F9432FA
MQEIKPIPSAFNSLKDQPKKLYFQGNTALLTMPKVSIVGTRHPISYTKQMCQKLAHALSKRGVCVVSGAAMGVDALAHRSAFPNTIAVMANSLDIVYPKVNMALIQDMAQKSLVLSEYERHTKATRYSFVLRNRLVVALGDVLVVAEADLNSGSMRSVEIAQKLGKKIYVFPHRLHESLGTNSLLEKHEATAIYDIDAFADQFGRVEENIDALTKFCQTHDDLDDFLEEFGTEIYDFELQGRIEISNMKVVLK